jgi:polyhydroxyalkanoate synthesis regulator phasin
MMEELKMDLLKQFFTLGLGAAAITKEQIEKTVDTLVKKGEVNANESKELVNQWIEKGEQAKQELDDIVKTRINQALSSFDLVTKEDYQELERRIEELESKIKNQ